MPRPRSGIGFEQNGVIYTGIRRADGSRRLFPIVEITPDGPNTIPWAKSVSLQLQDKYIRGEWDPDAVTTKAEPAPAELTVLELCRKWVKILPEFTAIDDGRRIETYLTVAPFGSLEASKVIRDDIRAFVAWLSARSSNRGGTLAARTVRNTYDAVRRAMAWASSPEVRLLPSSPCAEPPSNLPVIADKSREFRANAVFSRSEVVALCTDQRIPLDRRVFYSLLFLTGCRFGEVAALRWRHWSPEMEPLGRLLIANSMHWRTRKEKGTKSDAPREVPVHPILADVLSAWRKSWALEHGCKPGEDDYIVPNRDGRPRDVRRNHHQFQLDLDRLQFRARRVHDTRRTFISLCRDDGARGEVLRHVTHGVSKRDMIDVYSSLGWRTYCAEVVRLRLTFPEGFVTGFVTEPPETSKNPGKSGCEEGELNPRGGTETSANARNRSLAENGTEQNRSLEGGSVTGFVTNVTPRGDAYAHHWADLVDLAEWGPVGDQALLGPGGDA